MGQDDSVFAADIFSQAAAIAKEEGIELNKPAQQEEPLLKEDIEPIIDLPFFSASLMTKINELQLEDSEREKLTRLWYKVIKRRWGSNENLDIALAVSGTVVVFIGKYLIYQGVLEDRKQAAMAKQKQEQGGNVREMVI